MSSSTCAQLLSTYPDEWQAATVHPFLEACQQGSITTRQFNTWLVQDYLFVIEFTRMAARLLAIAPTEHFDTLLSGMIALKDELSWFQAKAAGRDLSAATTPQPTCQAYCQFMTELSDQSYAVQATAFWAIERSYNQGWKQHSPMSEPYAEFADRWGNDSFSDYVKVLEQQADSALATASKAEEERAKAAFLQVAQLEKDFWQMAFVASQRSATA
ncbi:MAG: TenA family transcriptional regulator [Cyanobacteria bacterium J06621_11]